MRWLHHQFNLSNLKKKKKFEQKQMSQTLQTTSQIEQYRQEVKQEETKNIASTVVGRAENVSQPALKVEKTTTETRTSSAQIAEKKQVETQSDARAQTGPTKPASSPKISGTTKFGLQCGAFKNLAQAEAVQAKLIMLGLDARIKTNADWHRVIVGPIGERSEANAAYAQIRNTVDCVVVGL